MWCLQDSMTLHVPAHIKPPNMQYQKSLLSFSRSLSITKVILRGIGYLDFPHIRLPLLSIRPMKHSKTPLNNLIPHGGIISPSRPSLIDLSLWAFASKFAALEACR